MRGKTAAWLDGSAPNTPFRRERLASGCCIIDCAGRDSIASSSWESASRIDAGARSCNSGTSIQKHDNAITPRIACRFIARPVHEADQGLQTLLHATTWIYRVMLSNWHPGVRRIGAQSCGWLW